MSDRINQLMEKMLKLGAGEEFGCVYSALSQGMENILRKIPNDQARDEFIITQIHSLVWVTTNHGDVETASLKRLLEAISRVRAGKQRNAAILGHIKALTHASIDSEDFDEGMLATKMAILYMPYDFIED